MLQIQSLLISDFSGGITENILADDPRRSEKLDNFYIAEDKSLLERGAFTPHPYITSYGENSSGMIYPVENNKVFRFFDSKIYVSDSSKLNTLQSVKAVDVAGSDYNFGFEKNEQISYATLNNSLIYVTSDRGLDPALIYKPQGDYSDLDFNKYVAVKAGLPSPVGRVLLRREESLSEGIALANDIRNNFINHILNAKGLFDSNTPYDPNFLHPRIDSDALSWISDDLNPNYIGYSGPFTQAAATEFVSFVSLFRGLLKAYNIHAKFNPLPLTSVIGYSNEWHWSFDLLSLVYSGQTITYRNPGGIFRFLTDPDENYDATTKTEDEFLKDDYFVDLLQVLNDLRDLYNLHVFSPQTHYRGTFNELSHFEVLNQNVVTQPRATIYIEDTPLQAESNFEHYIAFVNNLKRFYQSHIIGFPNGSPHKAGPYGSLTNAPANLSCFFDDATTLEEANRIVYWMRVSWNIHFADSNVSFAQNITFNTTAGIPNLTSVVNTDTGAAITLVPGQIVFVNFVGLSFFYPVDGWQPSPIGGLRVAARVESSGSGTATLSAPVFNSVVGQLGQVGPSWWHNSSATRAQGFELGSIQSTAQSRANSSENLGIPYTTVAANFSEMVDLANDLWTAFNNHNLNDNLHWQKSSTYLSNYFALTSNSMITPIYAQYVYAAIYEKKITDDKGTEYIVYSNPIFSPPIESCVNYNINEQLPLISTAQKQNFLNNITTTIDVDTSGLEYGDAPYAARDAEYGLFDLRIYRTINAGVVLYKVDELDDGNVDTTTDADLTAKNDTIYFTGNLPERIKAPRCKFIYGFNGYYYFGGCWVDDIFYPNMLRQSLQNIPDSSPENFFSLLDDDITGIGSTRNNVIVFCKNSIYRITDRIQLNGQGTINLEKISDTVGSLNHKSIVQTEIGLFFAGTGGFYYTDGYQLIKLSLEIDRSYGRMTEGEDQKRSIKGTYDLNRRLVIWSIKGNASGDNDLNYVLHLNMGVKPSAAFSIWKNKDVLFASDILYVNNELLLATPYGEMLFEDKYNKFDFTCGDPSLLPTREERMKYVPYNYLSTAINLGTPDKRKYLTKVHIVGDDVGNTLYNPYIIRDISGTGEEFGPNLAQVNYRKNLVWGTPNFVWGDPDCFWKEKWDKVDVVRRMPAGSLRSNNIQVGLRSAEETVYSSSDTMWPEFTKVEVVDVTTPTEPHLRLVNDFLSKEYDWMKDIVGLRIRFDVDDYATEYEILGFEPNGDIFDLVVSDPGSTLVLSSHYDWEIVGFRKNQKVHVSSVSIHFGFVEDNVNKYQGPTNADGTYRPDSGGRNG